MYICGKEVYGLAYSINLGAWRSVFAVPSCVADNYIKIATGEQIKVLLYLLKNAGIPLRNQDISLATGVDASEVDDALLFWENVGVISDNGGAYEPSESSHTQTVQYTEKPSVTPEIKVALTSEPHYEPKEIAGAINSDKAVRYLFDIFEKLKGKPTTHSERNTLMILIEEIKLPCEVAVMLVEYCFSIDKASPAYMKTVALDWVENSIDTIGKAEERIRTLRSRLSLEGKLKTLFGMTSNFGKSQKEFISQWAELGLSNEMFEEAYDATMKGAGKLSFPYMDKILRKWSADGITSPEMINKTKKPAVKHDSESSFDINEIEQLSYERYKKK